MFEKLFNLWKRDRTYYDKEKAEIIRGFIDWYLSRYSYVDPYILCSENERFIDEYLKYMHEKEK